MQTALRTNLHGSGRRSTTLVGRADPLVLIADCVRRANVQTVSGLHLDGQNKRAGALGMRVENVRGLKIRDLLGEGFRGTSSGGALDIDHVWNADVGDSTFRNSGASFGTYASGTVGIRNATDSVFHDLDVYDSKYLAIKGGWTGDTLRNVDFYNLRCTVGSPQLVISSSLSTLRTASR